MAKKKNNREDKLARMLQREFAAIHRRFDETVTKKELESLREELKEDVATLRRDMEVGFLGIIHTLKAIQEELKELKGLGIEVASLKVRLARVERKVGIGR
ncbi:MAG: hypothetical protein HY434_00750 [Candidatus Liptonbacteria bacterium]|nr:hypothetical protein [Parcubacteria group bacterium]MBI4087345.1 hypothetical protein [Candidatus Liptonbacteria bacterium]